MSDQQPHRGMQRKTIKRILNKKLEDWVSTIDDIDVVSLVSKNTIVTGGSIASMLMGERVNDFDIYFRDRETAMAVARYYCKKFVELNNAEIKPVVREENITNIRGEEECRVVIVVKSAGVAGETENSGHEVDNTDNIEDVDEDTDDDDEFGPSLKSLSETAIMESDSEQGYEYFEMTDTPDGERAEEYLEKFDIQDDEEKPRYRPVFLSQNAITLSNQIQIVIRFYGEPEKIHDNYDFVHATSYYDWADKSLVCPSEALESMMSKTLIYRGSLYPICSLFRIRKFIDRGWNISAGQILKIAWQISEINLKDMSVLREQLTGVDQAYFYELIDIIEHYQKKAMFEGKKLDVDATYISRLIDRIFG